MRILVTGGSGKAGRHSVAYTAERGHQVVSVDRVPLNRDSVSDGLADVTDADQMFDVKKAYADKDEMGSGTEVPTFGVVVEFAAVPPTLLTSDNE